jgi:hypothetical protein
VSRSENLRRAFGMLTDVARATAAGDMFAIAAAAGEELDALERELLELRVAAAERPTTPSLEDAAASTSDGSRSDLGVGRVVGALRARVADLEKERAGLLATLETTRADHAALRAELETSVDRHGQTSRELTDARAALAELDGELAGHEAGEIRARELVAEAEADATRAEAELTIAEAAMRAVMRAKNGHGMHRALTMVQSSLQRLDARRSAPVQRRTGEQAPTARRSRTNARATEPKGSGSSAAPLSASSARKRADHTRLPKLPPPAPAPDKIGSNPPRGDDKDTHAPDPGGSRKVQNG